MQSFSETQTTVWVDDFYFALCGTVTTLEWNRGWFTLANCRKHKLIYADATR